MTERVKERLGYLSDEFEDHVLPSHLRSVSPHTPSVGSRSPRRRSRSPRPHKNVESPTQNPATVIRDSRPDIAAWPAPPGSVPNSQDAMEEPSRLLTMFKVAASTGAPRGRETELKKKIQTLQDTVAAYERQKCTVLGTFSEYRERVAERERKLEAEYSSKIIALSEEVLGAKKDFEARMKNFQALQEQFEREKEQALEKLRQEHQKEIQLLEQRFSESQLLNLEQKYMIEIQRLEEERKSLRAEKERLGETFEMKLRRAQSLYETELTAAKMLYSKELEALRDHEEALKEELLARQDEFHDRLQELQHQSKRSREELATCKNEVTALEKRLQAKEAEVAAISKELEEARNETNDTLRKLSKVENELQQTKQKYREQEEELQRKSNLLNIVETAKSKLEAVIRDLQTEVKALKNKVEFLEKERENLQSQSESQTQLQNSQVHALEAVLETVTKEKESTKEHYEGLLDRERQQAEEREYAMKKEFSAKLNELEEQYNTLKEQLEQNALHDREELQDKTRQEIASVRSENSVLIAEVNALKSNLASEADDTNESEENRSHLSTLIEKMDQLRKDLDERKTVLQEKDEEIKNMKTRLEQETELSDDQLAVIREEIRLEILNSDEFTEKETELKSLREQVIELENGRKMDERQNEALSQRILKMKKENDELRKQKREAQQAAEGDSEKWDHSGAAKYKAHVANLEEQISKKQQKIEEMEAAEKRMREEFESHLEERVEEETLKATSMYESKFDEVKRLEDEKNRLLEEEMQRAKEESSDKTGQIVELHTKVNNLLEEISSIREELEKKNAEIKAFSKKTDEYLRRRENHQAQTLEKKIINLNKEHEKTIDLMKEHEAELAEKLKQLQQQIDNKPEMLCNECQTECAEAVDATQTEEEEQEGNTATDSAVLTRVEQLENALKEKDSLIAQLQEELVNHLCCDEPEHEGKKNRSQSVASGEHLAICQKAASKLQTLVSQMTEKKEKNKAKSMEKQEDEERANEETEQPKSKKEKEREKSEKEKEREKEKKEKEKDKASQSSSGIQRAKSPGLLTRLRDRSPAKAKSPTVEPKKDEKKNLLSPSDAERVDDRRKGSPSRQLFSRSKKDVAASAVSSSSPGIAREDSGKRPAWKF